MKALMVLIISFFIVYVLCFSLMGCSEETHCEGRYIDYYIVDGPYIEPVYACP